MKPKHMITVMGEKYYYRATYNTAFLVDCGNKGADKYYGNKSITIKGQPVKKSAIDYLMCRPDEHEYHVYATRVTKRTHKRK